jgi:hypothetical protein
MPKVVSLGDLLSRAAVEERYRRLAVVASQNLGGPGDYVEAARWLMLNALETTEQGVVAEVNAVRDLV